MRWLCALALAGCGFRAPSSNPTSGDDAGGDDASVASAMLVFDTQADFTQVGAAFDQLGTEPWGSLTSAAYVQGALVAHGLNQQLWDAGMTDAQLSFAIASNTTPDGAAMWRAVDADGALAELGSSGLGNWSAWFEGEVYLGVAGDHTFSLDADDVAFLELADPGSTAFHHVVAARWNGPIMVAAYHAAQPGWYPFRIGWGQGIAGAHLHVRHGAPGQPLAPFARSELRGRGDKLRGLMRDVLDHQLLAGDGETIGIETQPFMSTNALGPPGSQLGEWSARWTGEVYITAPGDYTLSVTSDDGNHVILDAASQSAAFGRDEGDASAHTDTTATLDAGWHPLVVDYNQVNGAANLDVRWSAAPDASLVDKPVSIARLRPVETRRARIVPGAQPGVNAVIRDNQLFGTRAGVTFPCFAGEAAGIVDITARVLTGHPDDMNVGLIRPDGTELPLCAHDCPFGAGGWMQLPVTDAAFLAPPADGTWQLHVWDDRTGIGHTGDSLLSDVYLTLRTHAGPPTVADHGVWTSQIVTLDHPLVDITAVTWTALTPRSPDDVAVQLRACATPDCAGEPWSAPITNGGAPAVIPGRRYVQVQVALDSDGDRETELQQLAIAYRVTP